MNNDGVSLKEHFETILSEKDKALAAALIAVKEENRKTEVAAEKRFELLNELRGGVATREQLEALEKSLEDLKTRIDKSEGRNTGLSLSWGVILGGAGLISTILAILSRITQ